MFIFRPPPRAAPYPLSHEDLEHAEGPNSEVLQHSPEEWTHKGEAALADQMAKEVNDSWIFWVLGIFLKILKILICFFFYTLLGQDCLLDHDHARKS